MDGLARLARDISTHARVFLDSAVLSYHFTVHPTYAPLTTMLFDTIARHNIAPCLSTSTIAELLVQPLSVGRNDIAAAYEAQIDAMANLTVVEFDRPLARPCARASAETRLRLPDATQIASARACAATAIVSNDLRWRNKFNTPKLILLEDYL